MESSQPGGPSDQIQGPIDGTVEGEPVRLTPDQYIDQTVSELESPTARSARESAIEQLLAAGLDSMTQEEAYATIGRIRGEYQDIALAEAETTAKIIENRDKRTECYEVQEIYLMLGSAVVLRALGARSDYIEELTVALNDASNKARRDEAFADLSYKISDALIVYLMQFSEQHELDLKPEDFDQGNEFVYYDARNLVGNSMLRKDNNSDPEKILSQAGFSAPGDY